MKRAERIPDFPSLASDVPLYVWHIVCFRCAGKLGACMIYDAYQSLADVGDRVRKPAENAQAILEAWSSNPFAPPWRRMAAYYELVALAGFTHARPDYGIDSVERNGEQVPGRGTRRICGRRSANCCASAGRAARTIRRSCWSRRCPAISPRCCAARSARCCSDHQVFITDWINPRNVKLGSRRFCARRLHPAPDRLRPPSSARTAISWRSASRRSRRSPRPR